MNTTIRDMDDWIFSELKQQAAASGRSQQAYMKHILCEVAKTPLPLSRDVLCDLLKEPVRALNREASELHLSQSGEVWGFLSREIFSTDEVIPTDRKKQPARLLGLAIVFADLPAHTHARLVGKGFEVDITTELIWKSAAEVNRTIHLK